MKNDASIFFSLILVVASLLTTQAAYAATPSVVSAVANFSTNQITIKGSNFGTSAPKVLLDGSALQVVTYSETNVIATLSTATNPGTYLLTLTTAANGRASFDVTIGAAGPEGPQGLSGPQGAEGIQGIQGPQGVPGVAGAQGPAGMSVGSYAAGYSQYIPGFPGALIAQNVVQTSGTYFVSASAIIVIDAYDNGAFCYDQLGSNPVARQYGGSGLSDYSQQASITDSVYVNAGDSIQVWCYGENGDYSSWIYNAALTSILINTVESPNSAPGGTAEAHRSQQAPPARYARPNVK